MHRWLWLSSQKRGYPRGTAGKWSHCGLQRNGKSRASFSKNIGPTPRHLEDFSDSIITNIIILFSYKPHKNQPAFLLSTLSSFFLYLFNKYLFNTYCVPGIVCTRCWCYKAEQKHLEAAIYPPSVGEETEV